MHSRPKVTELQRLWFAVTGAGEVMTDDGWCTGVVGAPPPKKKIGKNIIRANVMCVKFGISGQI